MKNQENNNLAKENAALKQKLQQKEKELASFQLRFPKGIRVDVVLEQFFRTGD